MLTQHSLVVTNSSHSDVASTYLSYALSQNGAIESVTVSQICYSCILVIAYQTICTSMENYEVKNSLIDALYEGVCCPKDLRLAINPAKVILGL